MVVAARAFRDETGRVGHHAESEYHGNPIEPSGSLVTTEWGFDFRDFVYRTAGLTTTAVRIRDRRRDPPKGRCREALDGHT